MVYDRYMDSDAFEIWDGQLKSPDQMHYEEQELKCDERYERDDKEEDDEE